MTKTIVKDKNSLEKIIKAEIAFNGYECSLNQIDTLIF